ncbi:hypothetical protein BDV32DRAFT_144437 [Aspergillus pseudonomiae]|uniref:Uncharacterized protein n=1 Tax=Aspergillus pseudonomiae TaxID=1506151 RepID=A0A5N7DCV9_9EURO|nr:uncharacterized protein BDV37DRAFT_283039 [Aspergillus pseudonomiae]KAB8265919.1 hypothetical protein BDV32DRAFT_144437 [Aspergillus pseudonomiae]KAE8404231.1 hypothetical protein BDV37DRAFT_283039 [Aspergillus pseudonomiae]
MEPTVNPTAVDRTASTTTTTNTAAIQGQACDAPRNDSSAASESPLSDVTNSIASVAGNSINEAKNKLATVASDESVQSVWEQVRSMATGRNDETQVDTSPSQDEIDLIDNMDNEKIAEFLREKNRSDARLPKRR